MNGCSPKGAGLGLFDRPRFLSRSGASASEIAAAHSLVPLVQRIAAGVRAMQAADAIDTEVAMRFGLDTDDLRAYNALLLRMPADGELRRQIAAFDEGLQPLLKTVVELLGDVQPLTAAKQAGSQIFEDSVPLLARSAEVTEALTINSRGFSLMHGLAAVSALLAVLVLVQMVRAYGADLAGRRQETDRQRQSAENDRNLTQQAILRLMNEMGDLADGDLTIRATVTEDITGAIADSVNYTIEELSVLVRRINDAASRVTAATESARHTSTELLAATERQSQEIEEAVGRVEGVRKGCVAVFGSPDPASGTERRPSAGDLGDGPVRDGVLQGDLYLQGGGDPKLVSERLWLLLRRVQGLGIRRIAGDIRLDPIGGALQAARIASTASQCHGRRRVLIVAVLLARAAPRPAAAGWQRTPPSPAVSGRAASSRAAAGR